MKKMNLKLRVTEADALSDALVELYARAAGLSGDSYLSGVMGEVKERSASLTTAIKRTKVSSSLDEADAKRDEAVLSLGTILAGYAALPIAAKKQAAQNVIAVYNKYGKKIARANYADESSLIESLLEDLAASALSADIDSLEGVSETIAALREAETAFKAANADYVQKSALASEQESAYVIKKSLVALINDKLLPYLDTMKNVNPALYADFAKEVELAVNRANETVAKRAGKAVATGEE